MNKLTEPTPFISIEDTLMAMFNRLGTDILLLKYGKDCPPEAIQAAYTRAEAWLCGGLAIGPQPEGVQ